MTISYNILHQAGFTGTTFIVTSSIIPTTSPLQSTSGAHSAIMGLFVMLSHTLTLL